MTDQMLVAFGEHGVTSIEDLVAACATDDLDGWSESKDGTMIRARGVSSIASGYRVRIVRQSL